MIGIHTASWRCRGWMSFTVPAGNVLRLSGAGGAGITGPTPTSQLSPSNYLASGIPQVYDGATASWRWADSTRGESNGHTIKHIVYEIISGGTPVNAAAARLAACGSTPTATLGKKRLIGEERQIVNAPDQLLNFALYNNTDNNMVVEIEVFE